MVFTKDEIEVTLRQNIQFLLMFCTDRVMIPYEWDWISDYLNSIPWYRDIVSISAHHIRMFYTTIHNLTRILSFTHILQTNKQDILWQPINSDVLYPCSTQQFTTYTVTSNTHTILYLYLKKTIHNLQYDTKHSYCPPILIFYKTILNLYCNIKHSYCPILIFYKTIPNQYSDIKHSYYTILIFYKTIHNLQYDINYLQDTIVSIHCH